MTVYLGRIEFRDKVLGGAVIPKQYRESEVTNCLQRTNEGYLCLEARQIRSALVEARHILYPQHNRKKKQVDKAFFIRPEFIVLEPARREPDSIEPLVDLINGHTILSYSEAVHGAAIQFELTDNTAQPIDWTQVWEAIEENGLGAARFYGYGKFDLTKWEEHA